MPPVKTAMAHLKKAVSELEKMDSVVVKKVKTKSIGTSPMKEPKVKKVKEPKVKKVKEPKVKKVKEPKPKKEPKIKSMELTEKQKTLPEFLQKIIKARKEKSSDISGGSQKVKY